MARTILFILAVIGVALSVAACGTTANEQAPAGLANPASVYCEEEGGTLEIRTATDGGEYGVCIFDDGSECEEWAFFRDECAPGDNPDGVSAP